MGKACTFIGDSFIPKNISFDTSIIEIIPELINNKGVDEFRFSKKNKYQRLCVKLVTQIKKNNPNIRTVFFTNRFFRTRDIKRYSIYNSVVYTNKDIFSPFFTDLMFHHKWAIKNSDIVVVYTTRKNYMLKKYIENSSKEVIMLEKHYCSGKRIIDNE